MICFAIQNFVQKNAEEMFQLIFYSFISIYPIQISVRFQNVQMRVHRFFHIEVFRTEALVVCFLPVCSFGLNIPAKFRVESILFHQHKHRNSHLAGLFVFKCEVIFRKCINKKSLSIKLLFGVFGPAIGENAPVNSTVCIIPEIFL